MKKIIMIVAVILFISVTTSQAGKRFSIRGEIKKETKKSMSSEEAISFATKLAEKLPVELGFSKFSEEEVKTMLCFFVQEIEKNLSQRWELEFTQNDKGQVFYLFFPEGMDCRGAFLLGKVDKKKYVFHAGGATFHHGEKTKIFAENYSMTKYSFK